ncbi:MAG: TonB-dependent receptor, partial [Pseudomonadota bacterium]
PDERNLLYLSLAEGYLPGGYNYNTAGSDESLTFEAEHSRLLEIGWKNRHVGNRFTSAVYLYQTTTEDKQIVDLLPGFVQSVSNAGETESYGIEVELGYQVTSALTGYFNLGFQRTEAVEFVANNFGTRQNLSGNDLIYAPEHSYSAGLLYDRGLGWFANLHIRASDDYYFDSANMLEQSGFEIIDAEIGYRFKQASISLWFRNLTDEEVASRAINTPTGVVVEDTLPQTTGIKLLAKFD